MGFLTGLWRFKGLIGTGLAALALGVLWIRAEHFKNEAEEARIERNEAIGRANTLAGVVERNEQEFQRYKAEVEAQKELVREANAEALAAVHAASSMKEAIHDAPQEDTGCPVSPVVLDTLERLREVGSGTDPSSGDRSNSSPNR